MYRSFLLGFTFVCLTGFAAPVAAVTITFDAGAGQPVSYSEAGLTVAPVSSAENHVHLGDHDANASPDLMLHPGCCSTPYRFTFAGGRFTPASLELVIQGGTHTFASSAGGTLTPTADGTVRFPAAGWTGVTAFTWHDDGISNSERGVVDNLKFCPGDCDDQNVCTTDGCDPDAPDADAAGCVHRANELACDDGLFCNGIDTCHIGTCRHAGDPCAGATECANVCNEEAEDCLLPPGAPCGDDGNICTDDECDGEGTCRHPANGAECDDGNACTRVDSCVAGVCRGGAPVVCTALDQCHDRGTCDAATGRCDDPAKPDATPCEDGDACTGTAACVGGVCTGADPVVCLALDQCHEPGICDPATGRCSDPAKPDGAPCDDGFFCTGVDRCHAGGCQADAGDPCAASGECANLCDESRDTCLVPPGSSCTPDGNLCTDDVCDGSGGCGHPPTAAGVACPDDGNVCTDDVCDGAGACGHPARPDGTPCDDLLFCSVDDACHAGACASTLRSCEDGNACTADACDEGRQRCENVPDPGLTDQPCEGRAGRCRSDGTCHVLCDTDAECPDDDIACTSARCENNGSYNACVTDAVHTRCDDGIACTRDLCDPSAQGCVHVPADALCDDHVFCNGKETCNPERGCENGPRDCSDRNECTADGCDEAGGCLHDPAPNVGRHCNADAGMCGPDGACSACLADGDCDDGLFCNGPEACDPATRTCQAGTPPDVSDGVVCTVDRCVDAAPHAPAHVEHEVTDARCDDGDFCSGVETCHPLLDCQPGTPPELEDQNDCTQDVCDDSRETVVHEPLPLGTACDGGEGTCDGEGGCVPCVSDADCDDGAPCNGTEICSAARRCIPGPRVVTDDGIACTIDGCDSSRGVFHLPDDGACDDGTPCTTDQCSTETGCLDVALPDGSFCMQAGIPSTCSGGLCGGCRPSLSAVTNVPRAVLNAVEEGCPTCPSELRGRYLDARQYGRCVGEVVRVLRRGRLITPRQRRVLRRAARLAAVGR